MLLNGTVLSVCDRMTSRKTTTHDRPTELSVWD